MDRRSNWDENVRRVVRVSGEVSGGCVGSQGFLRETLENRLGHCHVI